MTTRIAINGFGRIGRAVARILCSQSGDDLELDAVNDLTEANMLAHLLKYDSVHRSFPADVTVGDGGFIVGDKTIRVSAERDPSNLDWGALGVDVVLECTGIFRKRAQAAKHIEAGAKRVIVSAPSPDADVTIVMGVNHDQFDGSKHQVVSNASCTTNCLAPPAKVLLDHFGIERGMLTTVHSYTNDQALLDVPHRKGDFRRSRAGAANMVPTTTVQPRPSTASSPNWKASRWDGRAGAYRERLAHRLVGHDDEIDDGRGSQRGLKSASESGPMAGILAYTDEQLVSSDYIGNLASCTIDGVMTQVLGGNMVKLIGWYDNEWGFSHRMVSLTKLIG